MVRIFRVIFVLALLCQAGCFDVDTSEDSLEDTQNLSDQKSGKKYYAKVKSAKNANISQPYAHLYQTKVMGKGVFTEQQMYNYLQKRNLDKYKELLQKQNTLSQKVKNRLSNKKYYPCPNERLQEFARLYISECKIEGVNHDVAFAQMCHETGFLTFTGDVDPSQNNFAGIGTFDGKPGHTFRTVNEGIRAHVQHLKGYGSREPLSTLMVDPRYKTLQGLSKVFGQCKTLQDLTGKWATDKNYHEKIAKYLYEISLTK